MTKEFQALLRLVGAACLGGEINMLPPELDWAGIGKLAKVHNVQTLIGYGLRINPNTACPNEIRSKIIADMRQAAFSNNAWRTEILHLLKEMRKEGISAVLIKGYAIADCYSAPDCRLSSDTDLLIDKKDEKRACDFLSAKGFHIDKRWAHGHHSVCTHPTLGCVELHVKLYDEIVEDVWFDKMHIADYLAEPYLYIETDEGTYLTLGHTDHLLFLVLHLIKHFILSGMTIQLMTDVALYYKKYSAQIDLKRFWNTIRKLQYDKLLNTILWAMIGYFGFCRCDFPGIASEMPEHIDAVLADLEEGGWMGQAETEARKNGWMEYNRLRMMREKSRFHYWTYMLNWKLGQYLHALFPALSSLGRKYPYVLKKPWLYPLAWFQRLTLHATRAVFGDSSSAHIAANENDICEVSRKRLSLFKKLNML